MTLRERLAVADESAVPLLVLPEVANQAYQELKKMVQIHHVFLSSLSVRSLETTPGR